jgi:hypothetical protein
VNLSTSSRADAVPELQAKSKSSDDIPFDCASAPGATASGHSLRRYALKVEPPARDPIHTLIKYRNCVNGVPRRDEHTVASVTILVSHVFERSSVRDPGCKRLRDGDLLGSSEACCAVPLDTSISG